MIEDNRHNEKTYRTLLLNLPNDNKVIRRYMCSYNAPNLLFPPLELLALGGIVRDWKKGEAHLIDAIAEDYNTSTVIDKIESLQPDLIVSIIGFECFQSDINAIKAIKERFPSITYSIFGHYPTHFSREILEQTPVDFVLLGEPDVNFSELYDTLKEGRDLTAVDGIAYRSDGKIKVQESHGRINDINTLPIPSYELLLNDQYFEPFMPKPFGLVQSARGCPYQCNYCVKSFGTKLTVKTPEKIIAEIQYLKDKFNIRSLRFIDDTFTVDSKRVIEICKLMIEKNFQLHWSCLTRSDTINEEMVMWMKKAGCKRVDLGIESGSERILELYNKRMDLDKSLENLLLCNKYGIETMGFFMVGLPEETKEDFEKSLEFAIKAKLDYVLATELRPYPGTPLYEQMKELVDFNILPYRNEFKDPNVKKRQIEWEKEFFRRFYLRTSYIIRMVSKMLKKPGETIENASKILRFALTTSPGEDRRDFY